MTSRLLRLLTPSALALLVLLGPFANRVEAQDLCGTGMVCADGRSCLYPVDSMTRGVCLPPMPCEIDLSLLRARCFDRTAGTLEDRFRRGDCDGDLVPNERERDGELCDGALVMTLDPIGNTGWQTNQRLDEDGSMIAPYDAISPIVHAIGIGCTDERPCPELPTAPEEIVSRCVYLTTVMGENRGVCTYYFDDRDDRSCLGDLLDRRCLDLTTVDAEPHYVWEHGDCDADGLINKLDPRVCEGLSVISRSAVGPVCASGATDLSCSGREEELAPGFYGCSTAVMGGADLEPFGLCCTTSDDCPILELGSGDVGQARCVRLGPDATRTGVCTYSTIVPAGEDVSCTGDAALTLDACFDPKLGAYASWLQGDCNGCDALNGDDVAVCTPCPIEPDAAVVLPDAAIDANVDASALPDAAIGPLDDGGADVTPDAHVEDAGGPSRFSGSGCTCRVGARANERRSSVVLVAGLALALSLAARRRTRR